MSKCQVLVFIALSTSFFSCTSGDPSPAGQSKGDAFSVVLITDVGGRGDKGFNDAGWAGCEDAQRRLAERGVDIEIKAIESREQTDYIDNLNLAAERSNVVLALGFLIAEAVEQVAPHHADKSFIFIDGKINGANIASFEFKSQEAAFLAGILASYVSRTETVAVMPGMDIPPVEAFAAGYRAGVRTGGALQQKEVKALSSTIGSFNDPVKAKSIAQSLIGQGADILFQLSGVSGLGVIEAVKEAADQRFAIGVDIDQDDLAPGKVLTSVLKRMDRVVSDQIIAAFDGQFTGGIYEVGLHDGYVGLTEMKYTNQFVPEAATAAMKKAEELIAAETIQIPYTYAELENFQPPIEQMQAQ